MHEEEEEEEEDKKNRFIRNALCTKKSCLLIQNLSSQKTSSSVVRKFDKSIRVSVFCSEAKV